MLWAAAVAGGLTGCVAGPHASPSNVVRGHAPAIAATALEDHAPPAPAARKPFTETFGARVGGVLIGTFETEASLNAVGTGLGSTVDFESDLGLDGQAQSLRADAYYRFGREHRVDVAWFTLNRSATRNIEREINWGGDVYPINTSVTAEFDVDILQARYTWYFLSEDECELGAGIGIYGMNLHASLRADNLGLEATFDTPLPLPALSVQGAWEFAPSLQLVGALQFFFVELEGLGETEEITGSLVDLVLGLEYQLADEIGLGLAYNYFNLQAGAVNNQLDLDVDYAYSAVFAYMTMKI